jgi:hypothetical protein
MKKFTTSLMAICAIAGVGSALAFAPRHNAFATKFFVQLVSGQRTYLTTAPSGHGISCQAGGTSCSISTTLTITTLNNDWQNGLPPTGSSPYVNYTVTNQAFN